MQRNKGVSGSIVLEELIEMHINPQIENDLFVENREETCIETKFLWQRLVDKLLDFIIPRLKSSKMLSHFARKLNCKERTTYGRIIVQGK